MKKLMLTTALVAATSFGAVAQTSPDAAASAHDQVAVTEMPTVQAFLATDFIGKSLYALDNEAVRALDAQAGMSVNDPAYDEAYRSLRWSSSTTFAAARDDWTNIGAINDIVVTQDGEVRGVLADVGGFLGMLSRTVMVDIDDLYFVYEDASTDDLPDFQVVAAMSRDQIEALSEWDAAVDLAQGYTPGMPDSGHGPADAMPDHQDTTMQTAPQPVPDTDYAADGYAPAVLDERTAEALTGANVHDAENDSIGVVSDLVLDEDSAITHLLVDVGGFLGIGSHTVALPVEDVDILWNDADADVRVHVQMTREQLENMPEHQG